MIFQEPMTALNPAYTIGDQLDGGLSAVIAGRRRRRGARRAPCELLEKVGIASAGERLRPVPAPAFGRAAPARDDRHGADVRARAAHRRRADHGARRDHPGADPAPARRSAARARHRAGAHHPRPRHRGAHRRPRRRDVCRRDRRGGDRGRALSRPAPSLHARPDRLHPGAGPHAARRDARRDPGRGALADRRVAGLRLPRPLRLRSIRLRP